MTLIQFVSYQRACSQVHRSLKGKAGSRRRNQRVKSSRSCHAPVGLMQHSAWWVLHRSAPLPCLYAGGVSVCTGLCQLTLICLISTSKSLTSPHANKHIQSSFKPKPLSNTCLISRGPERRFIMHLKKCPAPALQAESSLLPGFYVIALTFSGGCLHNTLKCVCLSELLPGLVTADWACILYS